jgi:hypothetical protein
MRFSLKKHPTAYGFAFLANDSVFPQVPRTITSPYPSILPNTDSLKALSSFREHRNNKPAIPLKADHALDVSNR